MPPTDFGNELNDILRKDGPAALRLLSERGRKIYFPKMGMVAQGFDAKGKSINASIGEAKEDDGLPLRLELLARRVKLPPEDVFSYASSFGKPALRDRWAAMIREKNPSLGTVPISRPVVTNAITHALSVAGYLFLDSGDNVIVPDLYWGNYNLIFSHACGARLCTFETFEGVGSDAMFSTEGMHRKLMKEEKEKIVLLLNFPNNPTGYTPTVEVMDKIIDSVHEAAEAGKTILVITDDAYFGLVYSDGVVKESPFARLANLHENVVVCKADGATKEDYVWGFRVGFITFAGKGLGPEALAVLEAKAGGAVRGSISNDSHLGQSLLLSAYNDPQYALEKQRAYNLLKSRHDAVVAELDSNPQYMSRFQPMPFNSGYFMCLHIAGGYAEDIRQKLLKDYDTGVISIDKLIRVAFSCLPVSQIPQLFRNIYDACEGRSWPEK